MAPTLVASYTVDPNNSALTTTTTASFTPAAGEVIVVKAWNEWTTQPTAGTPTGGSLTYTLRASATPASQSSAWLWTAVVGASPGSMTVSVPWSANAGYRAMTVERWSNATLAATPATNSTKNGTASAPSATVTTTATNSVVTWIDADRNQSAGTVTYRSSATEVAKSQTDTAFSFYAAYQAAASAGSQTIGMTSPSGQNWTMLGVELLAAVPASVPENMPSRRPWLLRIRRGVFQALGTSGIPRANRTQTRRNPPRLPPVRRGRFQVVVPVRANFLGANSIPSGETFGHASVIPATRTLTATGIASGQAFGTASVVSGILHPTGIASPSAYGSSGYGTGPYGSDFGAATVTVGTVTLLPVGIPSGEAFGPATVTQITGEIPHELVQKARRTVTYELLVVARVPQTSGPPTLLVVDPIEWVGLSFTDELSKPQQLNASAQITGLTEPVIQRLRNLSELATELWVYRNGALIYAGPLLGWQIQNETITFQSQGLLVYLNWMIVTGDVVFSNVDQFQIVKSLIDAWQVLEYGNFGLDTSDIGLSGIVRDATYLKAELHNVGQRVGELGARINGFNLGVDPPTRKVQLWFPRQGVDRSGGPGSSGPDDVIVFDAAVITDRNVVASAGIGDVASEAFATGTSSNNPTVYSTQSNLALRAQFGRTGISATFDGVSEQTTIDDHALGLVNARDQALLIPGPKVRVTPDTDILHYTVGDTVSYQLHDRLGLVGAFRLRKRTVSVSQTGQETTTLEFV